MRVLHVVHRVVVVLGQCQVNIKHVISIGFAAEQEKAHGVFAGPVNQVAQGDVAARAFGDFDLLAAAHDPHHGVQHIVRKALWNAHPCRLQPRPHPRDGAVVVGALNVHYFVKATLKLADVVGHIGHEVGESAIAFSHHPVFVIAIVGGFKPQRAVFFKGFASVGEALDGRRHLAAGVQAGFKVIVVKPDGKGLQIKILLVPQVSHGKLAHAVQIVDVAAAGEAAVVGLHGFFGQKIVRDIADVVAVVKRLGGRIIRVRGPTVVTRLEAFGAQLRAAGQRANLHARIVVIKLAVDVPALGLKQIANSVTQCCLAAMAHMQRPGWVGGDKLHHDALAMGRPAPELRALGQNIPHDLLLGGSFELDVDKAGAGNVNGIHPATKCWRCQQQKPQAVGQLARIELEWLGQLHCHRGGEVAVRGHFGRLKHGLGTRARSEFFQRQAQRFKQFKFYREHAPILRVASRWILRMPVRMLVPMPARMPVPMSVRMLVRPTGSSAHDCNCPRCMLESDE